jgi:hypothetical protein
VTRAVVSGGAIAAMLGAPDPAMASTATTPASHTFRIAVRTVFTLRDGASPNRLHSVSQYVPYPALSKRIVNTQVAISRAQNLLTCLFGNQKETLT